MAGNSLNLVDNIQGYLTVDVKNRLSSALGESRDRTELGINAAIPNILSGLDNSTSTPEGARRLANAVDDSDDGISSNLGSMFGRGSSSDMGSGVLQSVLGIGGLSSLTGNVGKASGLSGRSVSMLMGFLAPVIFGALKKIKLSRGLDASGLAALLSSQRSNFSAAMPEVTLRESPEETYRASRPVTHAPTEETYSAAGYERHRSSLGWLLPLFLLAGVLGLIWYGASRSSVRAGRDDRGLAEQTAKAKEQVNMGHKASFEALRTKYQPVIDSARTHGVQISNLAGRDGKLILNATAPSVEASNKVWDEIKRINPRMDDIEADIKVDSSLVQPSSPTTVFVEPEKAEPEKAKPTAPETEVAPTIPEAETAIPREKPMTPDISAEAEAHSYVVQSGDTLSSISKRFYGNSHDYMQIFNENKDILKNPGSLEVGQRLEIPAR